MAPPLQGSYRRLRQFLAYSDKVFGLTSLLDGIHDSRERGKIPTSIGARALFFTGLLRIRSFNALDPRLGELDVAMLLSGRRLSNKKRLCSIDTIARIADGMDVTETRDVVVAMIRIGERNKAFRDGWLGGMRAVAIDGWEPFSSEHRHCESCLTRTVRRKETDVVQYYHRYVVALLLGKKMDVVIDVEEIRNADQRVEAGELDVAGHEGELTAGKRLISSLRETYGRWIDIIVADALYANGPFFSLVDKCGYGSIVILKKATDQPYRYAALCWDDDKPNQVASPPGGPELQIWRTIGIRELRTFRGEIDVVRAVFHDRRGRHEWVFAATGKARKLAPESIIETGRGRWHIENTAFHDWVTGWNFDHVFRHSPNAILALLYLFVAAFNALQFFTYLHVRSYGRNRGGDTTRTIVRLVDEMAGDLARWCLPGFDSS